MWVLVIPAKLTWLLQPLDTPGFLKYKHMLRECCERERASTPSGVVPIHRFLAALYQVILKVLQGKRWGRSFDDDGFGQHQCLVASYVLEQMGLSKPPVLPDVALSDVNLSLLWPRNAVCPPALVLPHRRKVLALGIPLAPRSRTDRSLAAVAHGDLVHDVPLTRAASKRQLELSASQAAASSSAPSSQVPLPRPGAPTWRLLRNAPPAGALQAPPPQARGRRSRSTGSTPFWTRSLGTRATRRSSR